MFSRYNRLPLPIKGKSGSARLRVSFSKANNSNEQIGLFTNGEF